jgi:hypothetical protein
MFSQGTKRAILGMTVPKKNMREEPHSRDHSSPPSGQA